MSIAGWSSKAPALDPADAKLAPDTFEPYVRALLIAIFAKAVTALQRVYK